MSKFIAFFAKKMLIIITILTIICITLLNLLKGEDKRYIYFDFKLESVNENYNSNQIKLSYNDTEEIKKVVLKIENKEFTIDNGSIFELSKNLDGKKYKLNILVCYKDGKVEKFTKTYQLYNECEKTISKVEKTICLNDDKKYYETKIFVDEFTNKICKKDMNEYDCDNKKDNDSENNNNSGNTETQENSNTSEENSNSDTPNNIEDSSDNEKPIEIPETTNNGSCKLNVTKGTIGQNNWYVSNVTLDLEISGSNVLQYGITDSVTPKYNKKKSISITTDHNQKTYYGHVKYKDGTMKNCNISLKIDKTKPTVPTSVIKKNNSNGEIINNSSSYRNYKIWWGNYNSTDKLSGIDHYEFSTNCTGSKTGTLRSEYIYPLDEKDYYKRTYCIRSVDAAGNYSNWSDEYYFNIDLVKPTCSVSMTSGSNSDTLTVTAKDSHSGISEYSYNNSNYSDSNIYKIQKGTKVTVSVKDKAGNVGNCLNYRQALILVGDSRTYWLQKDVGGKRILPTYNDIYYIESYDNGNKEVYAVAKSGATRTWLLGKKETHDAGAYQVQHLLSYLSSKPIYYDVKIASNLGVNDINHVDVQNATSHYISAYNNLLNSSQNVLVDDKIVSSSWKKRGNVIGIDFNFISINPIDEKLLNAYSKTNTRTNSKIIDYNKIMKNTYGSKYLDASSNFVTWFNKTEKVGQPKFSLRTCVDINDNQYECEDGIHYSPYINKNYIYVFYKNKLLG